ncbi:ERF family protein [Prosthecobacter sp. SYSU 5D2]|uniref:ERF family protein n=1 Tax=Prosthecobacter sp. SYSU 5D2 TaxID=3134134 RepID=UPI0031FEBAED
MSKITLLSAIAAVRAKGLVAVKTARNTGINSDYASYADVWAILRPALDEQCLSVGFLIGSCRREEAAWVQTLTMEISTADELRSFAFEFCFPEGNRGVNLSQRQGMAQTYARRYALVSFFHIITGDDDDAQRLGMSGAETSPAMQPKSGAQFGDFCYAPALGIGHEETQGTWSNLADPNGDGSQMLGDHSEVSLGKMCFQDSEHIGLKAWLAERVSGFAMERHLTTYEQVRNSYPHPQLLPATADELTGDQLRNLSQTLKPAKK